MRTGAARPVSPAAVGVLTGRRTAQRSLPAGMTAASSSWTPTAGIRPICRTDLRTTRRRTGPRPAGASLAPPAEPARGRRLLHLYLSLRLHYDNRLLDASSRE